MEQLVKHILFSGYLQKALHWTLLSFGTKPTRLFFLYKATNPPTRILLACWLSLFFSVVCAPVAQCAIEYRLTCGHSSAIWSRFRTIVPFGNGTQSSLTLNWALAISPATTNSSYEGYLYLHWPTLCTISTGNIRSFILGSPVAPCTALCAA